MVKYYNKSVILSRKPGKAKDDPWSILIALFDENNPHLKGKTPFRVLEFENIEKVRLWDLRNISFYLAGNDLVINDLVFLNIELKKEDRIITLTGQQEL